MPFSIIREIVRRIVFNIKSDYRPNNWKHCTLFTRNHQSQKRVHLGGIILWISMEGSYCGYPWRDPIVDIHGGIILRISMEGSYCGYPWRDHIVDIHGGIIL